MAGKYSLITTLTLNAAGFNKGVDQAKKGAKALSDGVQTAGKTMAGAFTPLKGILGDLGGQLGGVADIASGGVGAFKKMIPAINGIKTALISTGIGAIVVALGTAFAALTSHLKGTEEGSMKLHKVLGYVKGAFNALLVRVQLLGEAVSLVFEGKFKQAGQKLKEAFSGGLLEEIKEDAEKMGDLAERENKLWKERLDWGYKEAELNKELNKQKLIADDKSKGILAQQKAINSAIAIQKQISIGNNRIATEEYEILKAKNAMGNASTEKQEEELALFKKKEQVLADEYSRMKELVVKQNELNMQARKTTDTPIKIASTSNIALPSLAPVLNKELVLVEQTEEQKLAIKKKYAEMVKAINDEELQNNLNNASAYFSYASQLTGALSNLFSAQKERELKDAGNSTSKKAQIERKYAQKSKAMAVTQAVIGTAGAVINALQTKPFVPLALASAALAGVLGGIQIATIKNQSFAAGGIVGGSSYMGDKVHAMVNSGEMILTRSQQRNLFDMIGGGANSTGGDVRFEIEGTKLVGVLSNYNRRINTYR